MKFTDILRRFRLTYWIYNFFRRDQLSHNEKALRKYGIHKKYFASISNADFKDKKGEIPWLDAAKSSQLLPGNDFFKTLQPEYQQALSGWSDNGFAILPRFFDAERIETVNNTVAKLLETGKIKWKYGNKLMFAIHHSDFLAGLGEDVLLKKILMLLLDREVRVFQSINFYHGSEQRTHSDSIHMTTFPLGYMIAVWVALEDIGPTQGPLHYYPGSHKLPYLLNESYENTGNTVMIGNKEYKDYENFIGNYVADKHLEKTTFHAKKGDILIWHANLLHGGDPHLDKNLTRKSMVFHYYAKDVVSYHEISQRPALLPK